MRSPGGCPPERVSAEMPGGVCAAGSTPWRAQGNILPAARTGRSETNDPQREYLNLPGRVPSGILRGGSWWGPPSWFSRSHLAFA